MPPELKTLSIDVDGEIGTLTLKRPDALNAMSPEMIFELTVAAAWLADEAPLRGLVVTGEGDRSFSGIPYPVIGAINGVAAGAGFSLALMCDFRIASTNAAFVVAYGRIGASPDGGMTYFLPRVVGPDKALQLLLDDPLLSADDALELGIVSKIVAPEELLDAARQKAAKVGAKAPHYVRMAKALIAQTLDNSLTEHLQVERHGIADSMATEDIREGLDAFFNGREARFTGR
jgi:2-(1,2-epoxy-1,2-dihydrophenyl)acetyl-CoA isomerase